MTPKSITFFRGLRLPEPARIGSRSSGSAKLSVFEPAESRTSFVNLLLSNGGLAVYENPKRPLSTALDEFGASRSHRAAIVSFR